MKKLLILLFSLLISFNSYGEWTQVQELDETNFYVDFDRIKTSNGYVYYWDLLNFLKPDQWGNMSVTRYLEGDCGVFRYKTLTYIFYKQQMGNGEGETDTPKNPEWKYFPPKSIGEHNLNSVCNYFK